MVSKAIENAQVKVESHNFDIRKHLVEYDDVANKQREIIYGKRRSIIEGAKDKQKSKEIRDEIKKKIEKEIENLVLIHSPEQISKPEHQKIINEFITIVPFDEDSKKRLLSDSIKIDEPQKLIKLLWGVVNQVAEDREKSLGDATARDIEKFVTLSVIDTLWIQHLDSLDDLREGIGLRAAGQRDPLVEYKHEAFSLFEKLMANIDYEIVHRIFKVQVRRDPVIEKVEEKGVEVHPEAKLASDGAQSSTTPTIPPSNHHTYP